MLRLPWKKSCGAIVNWMFHSEVLELLEDMATKAAMCTTATARRCLPPRTSAVLILVEKLMYWSHTGRVLHPWSMLMLVVAQSSTTYSPPYLIMVIDLLCIRPLYC